jgi:two-component system phosphate regulon sensor histidine kinase PhoR
VDRTAAGWHALIDAFPDPSLAIDADLTVLHANVAALDIFPRLRTGAGLALATRDPDLLSAIEAVAGGAAPRTVTFHTRGAIDRRLAARVAAIGAIAPAQPPRVLLAMRDLTEQDRLALMRADFVANASHELRTPLASLKGFVETLQGPARDDPAARQRFLAIMAEQSARMTRLIDDLLSLSRVEMHAHVPPKAFVDLADIVLTVCRELAPIAEAANVRLTGPDQISPRRVRGDRDELTQVFQNLIQNAIKYGHSGGRVDVTISQESQGDRRRVVVTVADDGPGIPPEHLPRLTERFYRVSAAASRDKGGTGLGLAIVKHILNRHGGDLRIASTLGRGSTFTVAVDDAD